MNQDKESAVKKSKLSANKLVVAILSFLVLVISVSAQSRERSTVVVNSDSNAMRVAERTNVNCIGYIQNSPISTNFEIVGADNEREKNLYAQGDLVYVNQGSSNGIAVGNTYSVVRPKGKVTSKFTKKRQLGFFVQEVGTVEIVRVKANVSIARVKNSCDSFSLGDLLQPVEARETPFFNNLRPDLDIFADPNGKALGRIVLARDGREAVSRDEVVYIDLGNEDSLKAGDYLTVFRPLGKGGVLNSHQPEELKAIDSEYGSETYRGTVFSNDSPRKAGNTAGGGIVTSENAKTRRPVGLRKVVGEMMVLRVSDHTATALITRNKQEIHTGDWVEVQ